MRTLEGREGSEVSGRGAQGDVVRGDKQWLLEDNAAWTKIWDERLRARKAAQVQGDEAAAVTAAKAEGSRGTQRKRGGGDGGRQRKKQKVAKQKQRQAQPQREVRSDGKRGGAATEANGAAGTGAADPCGRGEVEYDRRERLLDPVEVTEDMLPAQGGMGPGASEACNLSCGIGRRVG